MQNTSINYSLYAITAPAANLTTQVQQAIDGGITMLQIREKNCTTKRLIELAYPILNLCRNAGIPCIIDDDVEAARVLGADGVHVGQRDMKVQQAREILGDKAIIGTSAHNVAEAVAAEKPAQRIWAAAPFFTPAPSMTPPCCPMPCCATSGRQSAFRWLPSAALQRTTFRSCTAPALTAWLWSPLCSDSRM